MTNRMNAFAVMLVKRAKYVFAPFMIVLLLSFLLIGPEMWPIQINNTLDTLLEQGTEQAAIDKSIQQTFGLLDEIVILAYHDSELFTPPNLRLIKEMTDQIETVEGVKNCFSIANTPFFRNYEKNGESVVESAPLLDKIPEDAEALARLKAEATNNKLFRNNIISPDGNTAALNIILRAGLDPFAKEAIVRQIRADFTKRAETATGQFYFTGMHVFMETTGVQMQRDVMQFSIVSVILLFIGLYAIFRSIALALIGITTAGIANWLLFSTLHLLGKTLSISTTPVPAITVGLSIAYVLHLIVARKEGILDDVKETTQIFIGNFLSALTTMIGFLSLCLNPIPTLQDFGLFAGLGTFFAAISAMFFGFPLLQKLKTVPSHDFGESVKTAVESVFFRHRRLVVVVSVLIFFSGAFLLRMEVETDYYQYYLRSAPMVRSVDFVNRNIGGQYPIVVEFTTGGVDQVYEAGTLAWLEKLSQHAMTYKGVDKVITYLDLLNDGQRAFADKPEPGWFNNRNMVGQVAMMVNDAGPELSSYYVDSAAQKTQVFIRTSHINSAAFLAIDEGLRSFLARETPKGISYKIGGTYLRTVQSANRMAISQLFGTFLAFCVLFLVAFIAIPNVKLILMAFVANLLPIFGVYGLLGMLGETLNMGTTTIAAIAVGIGMDDTMHFLTRYTINLKANGDPHESARQVIHSSGVSMILTSCMISLAFLSLSLSIIKPIYQLGIFTSVTMTLCLLADLFLMPVLVNWNTPPREQSVKPPEVSNA
ncbi:MAG: MMPL family transporter [Candidatus Riflebacteria bacterium]|nr:MMPL family transporter [Candidatus Riflebacteria bacterium]